jgi:hypothetical protein
MKRTETQTQYIRIFAARSDRTVLWITAGFAFGGALLDSGIVGSLFSTSGKLTANSGLWGMWIPLCFITIPPIHYLCRCIIELENRLDALTEGSVRETL